ncbi:UNVERIFIED_CONTAM: hypothetical protein GTU68_048875 [Idotea baltica]|nr:hypothetical protein [Idotea baltica]
MAAIARKNITFGLNLVSRRCVHGSSTVFAKKVMPDPIEHSTGLERQELLAKAAGNENPFDMRVYKRTSGDANNPTIVPSFCKSRIVGCICQEEATSINWMWLTQGESKRCECGFFFKLTEAKPMV